MSTLKLQASGIDGKGKADSLHFTNKRVGNMRHKRFRGYINIMRFTDKDTNQIVFYAPALEISGYGETEEKAFSMCKESINNLFDMLSDLSLSDLNTELGKLGWKKNKLRNKDFSKAYVNKEGDLKNFNAVDNKVDHLALVAA